MVSELRAANPIVLSTLCFSQDKLGYGVVIGLAQPQHCCCCVHRCLSAHYQPMVSSRGLMVAQPLVGAATGSSPKPAIVSERPLVEHSVKGRQSGGPQTKSEVRGASQPRAAGELGAQGTDRGLCPAGVQSPHHGCPMTGSKP